MQAPASPHRRKPALAFFDHTPRVFEITAPFNPSQSPASLSDVAASSASMPLGAGQLYTNAIMGSTPSAEQRENVRKASSTILREDFIQVELHDQDQDDRATVDTTVCTGQEPVQRPESCRSWWSTTFDRTDQAPYTTKTDSDMNTQTSMPRLPKGNASHDLAFFLRTTGPTAPHRRPSKLDHHPGRAISVSKNAFRFLKVGQRRPPASVTNAHLELNTVLRDEGGLLDDITEEPLPSTQGELVEQKISSTGKRYLALKPKSDTSFGVDSVSDTAPIISPDIVDSRVAISFADDINYCSGLENWLYAMSRGLLSHKTPAPSPQPSAILGADEDNTVRLVYHSSSPVRPAASNPPSPEPESATSIAESYQLDLNDHPASHTLDANRALSSHPARQGSHPGAAASPIPLPEEDFPVKLPSAGKEIEIRHPCPRRFASHPVLLQRASSISSSMYPRSVSDSPGPPPPRSPLRLNRDPMSIEGLIAGSHQPRKATPGRMAPRIRSASDHGIDNELPTIIPSVVTECSGPIKRPKSRDRVLKHPLYPASRKEREERIKQRKLRDRPYVARTIDAVVNAPPIPTRRPRKARPHIQIPDLKPAPLTTRAPSAASSNASWKKVTENTMTPVSPVPSQEQTAAGEKTGYTPTSANASDGSPSSVQMGLSPVMLVAEEVPLPKARSTPKPARLILRGEGSKYAPRPRSASMSRAATKRRSRSSIGSISRPATPGTKRKEGKDDTPPLPSPPPNRALPPTPPASGSERLKKRSSTKPISPTDKKKELPIPPAYEILPPAPLAPRANQGLHHVSTQDQRLSIASRSTSITARLEALERQNEAVLKQNALLNAALMAVLKTNGSLNSPVPPGADPETPKGPMAWESRVARRSAASHAASSSNGSALEMYMSTRRGSQKGSAHEARG